MSDASTWRRHSARVATFGLSLALLSGCTDHLDLFACKLPPDCAMSDHLGKPDPPEAATCAADLVKTRTRGVITMLDDPGPYIAQTEYLVVVLGDGTGLVQTRHRECEGCAEADLDWESLPAHQVCALEPPEYGEWTPTYGGLGKCHDVEDRSCAEIAALLEAD